MAAGSRTLKLSILADIDDLKKNLNAGQGEVQGFGDKVSDFGKKAGLAFAAAGAAAVVYAGKLAIDGVKAAIEDEAAQLKLANALKASTGATEDQIASVEAQILKMSLATGTADDKLRPALQRLTLSTNDITKAQDLLSLALDISTSTGKPLEAVANSLGKAYDGNTAALGKLGLGLSAAELKTMTFDQVTQSLTKTFGGAAAANAETYAGKIARIKVGFDEAKESLGTALLPTLGKLTDFINDVIVPAFSSLIAGLSGDQGVKKGLTGADLAAFNMGETLKSVAKSVGNLFTLFNDPNNTGAGSGLAQLIGWIDNIVGALENLIGFLGYTLALLKILSDPHNWTKSMTETQALASSMMKGLTKVPNQTPTQETIRGQIKTVTPQTMNVPSTSGGGGGTGTTGSGATGTGAGGGSAVNGIPVGGSGTINDITNVPDFSNVGVTGAAVGGQVISYGQKFPIAPAVPDFSSLGMTGAAVGGSVVNFGRTLPDFSNVGVTGAAIGGTVINLNVSGSIDPEGTARTIVDTLNNSLFRGTGGANNLQLAQF